MSDKYVPTTDEMRKLYATNSYETSWSDLLASEFDRWLAATITAHDREVALQELLDLGAQYPKE